MIATPFAGAGAGTGAGARPDAGPESGEGCPEPVFVLLRPQLGENIGAAARAMWNFGLWHLRLVAPRDGWPNARAGATASGAGRVLDTAVLAATLDDAIADRDFVFATTARRRELEKPVFTPEGAMAEARAMAARGRKVGFLFGPERAGLENADLVRANAIVSVPVNPEFASLNLAQCVLLLAYEWRRGGEGAALGDTAPADPASARAVAALGDKLEDRLEATGFFWPEHKAESMRMNLRNLIARIPLGEADVKMLHGVFRALAERRRRDG